MPGRDLFPRLEYVSAVHGRFLKIYERASPLLGGERTKTGSNSIVDLTLPSSFFFRQGLFLGIMREQEEEGGLIGTVNFEEERMLGIAATFF